MSHKVIFKKWYNYITIKLCRLKRKIQDLAVNHYKDQIIYQLLKLRVYPKLPLFPLILFLMFFWYVQGLLLAAWQNLGDEMGYRG